MSTKMFGNVAKITLLLVAIAMSPMHPAIANPISYELSGVASGSIGTVSFANNSFTLIGTADTTGAFSGGAGVTVNPLFSLMINLNGFGTAFAVDPIYFFTDQSISTGGFVDLFNGDVFDFSGPDFATYDGISALAPVPVSTDFLAPYFTSLGNLDLTDVTALTFRALQPVSVPEPSSISLFVLGLIGVILLRQRGEQSLI